MAAISYISPIDPHVHLRGKEYNNRNPSFAELAFRDAKAVGLAAMIEQPNPEPNLTSTEVIGERMKELDKLRGEIVHRVHIGLTKDESQVEKALAAVIRREHNLVSDKTFYVHSTGDMGILDPKDQRKLWMIKGRMGYKGVSIGHFEDESQYLLDKFDPEFPITHSIRQPKGTELTQVIRQIANASDAKFKGIFYIAHVSNPDTVEFVNEVRRSLPFEVAIEMTWHHMLLNWRDYRIHGNRVKMNPALRMPKTQERLLEQALDGKIDVIGTDHAPHPDEQKVGPPNKSGMQAIPFFPKGIELVRLYGMPEKILQNVTFNNSNRIFKLGLTPQLVEIEYNPHLWKAYGFNPFSRIDGTRQAA